MNQNNEVSNVPVGSSVYSPYPPLRSGRAVGVPLAPLPYAIGLILAGAVTTSCSHIVGLI